MFVIIESYNSCEGTFSTHVGHTSDEEIAKTFVEKMNEANQKEHEEVSHFVNVVLRKWRIDNPPPERQNYPRKEEDKWVNDYLAWKKKEDIFIGENKSQTKYDKETYWTYEKSPEITLEIALGMEELIKD